MDNENITFKKLMSVKEIHLNCGSAKEFFLFLLNQIVLHYFLRYLSRLLHVEEMKNYTKEFSIV